MKLRDYQEIALEKAENYLFKKGGRSGIWHLATGAGKGVIITHAIDRFWNPQKGHRSLIVGGINRILTFQMFDALRNHFPYMKGNTIRGAATVPLSGIVMGNINQTNARCVVASIQSLVAGVDLKKLSKPNNPLSEQIKRSDFIVDALGNVALTSGSKRPYLISPRIDEMLEQGGLFDICIPDEAHHAVADGTVYLINYLDQIRALLDMDSMKLIGSTATPNRADDRGLHTLFETILVSYNISWMQRHGYLVDFADPKRVLIDTVEVDDYGNGSLVEDKKSSIRYVDNWAEIVCQAYHDEMSGRRCFAYWSNYNGPSAIEDSVYITEIMNANGIRAVHIDGTKCVGMNGEVLPKNAERELLDMLGRHELDVINNHGVLVEGVDVPEVDGIILGRRIAADNPVLLTQILGRGLRLANGKKDLKILDVTGQEIVLNSIADLTGFTIDPTSGQLVKEMDVEAVTELFLTLWNTRQEDVVLWRITQKRYKEDSVNVAFNAALEPKPLNEFGIKILNACNEFLTDEERLLEGVDLKDVRTVGKIRGVNQTYELIKIIRHSSGTWYHDNDSSMMSISLSGTDSFIILPPNHTNARIAAAACTILIENDGNHVLTRNKDESQISKLLEFFATAQRLYKNFTLWHLQGSYYSIHNKEQLWVLEDVALDVLENDAMSYARDVIPNYTAAFSEKKKAQSWKNKESTAGQLRAVAHPKVLNVSINNLPDDVLHMKRGELAKYINHTACTKYLLQKSAILQFDNAIDKIKDHV